MGVEIYVGGEGKLKEVYRNKNDVNYYVIVSGDVAVRECGINTFPKINVEIPISKKQYHGLKKQLSESKFEKSRLKIKGNLKISLDSVCFN